MSTSIGSKPPLKGLEREVNRVPKMRIAEGAKPPANDSTKHINSVPDFGSSKEGRQPPEYGMKKEVNPVSKGKKGGSAKAVGGWNQSRKKK